jgi:hypothetical protein
VNIEELESTLKPKLKFSFWYMHDNHTFTRLKSSTIDEMCKEAFEIGKESPYGMLCPVTVLNAETDKELRRVGSIVHTTESSELNDTKYANAIQQWKHEILQDADIRAHLIENI